MYFNRGVGLKILEKNYKKGVVKLIPETLDDLWHLYNIIYENDIAYARTTREIKIDNEYSRPQKGKRVSVVMGIKIKNVLWDKSLNRLRLHGTIVDAPEDVAGTGTFQTLNITLGDSLTIVKKEWAKHHVDRLEKASRTETPPIIVLSIDDEEYCIALIRQYGVDVKIEKNIKLSGKLEAEKRTTDLHKAFQNATTALKDVWQSTRSPIVILGLGFIKNQFFNHLSNEAPEIAKHVIEIKSVNSSGVAGIHEALRSGVLSKAIKHVRIAEEAELMEEVLKRLGMNRRDVSYGFADVENADMYGAIETLLVSDLTLRSLPDEKRLALEKIMNEVEAKNGKIVVISSEHEAGEKLQALGGIAALLRFPTT
jgi:protein pelota